MNGQFQKQLGEEDFLLNYIALSTYFKNGNIEIIYGQRVMIIETCVDTQAVNLHFLVIHKQIL